ncbi:LysR family transcriptional regulator [Agarilytica rhodophyticola]|uniref:LysR family transcriptional regulator n=1 Tax=Agarilytica rhodophyticola TaxID=1737490 RepID=UPI000B341275|nr:LysR family transcriptional regulator [Agarilytica rhodophyticola]
MLIDDLKVVLQVAEFKSIKQAAESLDMSVAVASAAVKRVEKAYGVELFVRSTRKLRLSSFGEKYIPQIENALVILNQVGQSAKNEQNIIDGDLRLAVPSDLGRNILLPWIDLFASKHPQLNIRLHITDSTIDFYRDPVDMALRYGAPGDSSMYGFKICDVPRILCASPYYVETYGMPVHLKDLDSHNSLLYQLHDTVHDIWEFSCRGITSKVKMRSNRTANDADIVRRWCVAGYGIAMKSALDMSDDLLSGNLVKLMPEYTPKPTELWLICPSKQLITPMVRLLRESITDKCLTIINSLKKSGYL